MVILKNKDILMKKGKIDNNLNIEGMIKYYTDITKFANKYLKLKRKLKNELVKIIKNPNE